MCDRPQRDAHVKWDEQCIAEHDKAHGLRQQTFCLLLLFRTAACIPELARSVALAKRSTSPCLETHSNMAIQHQCCKRPAQA